MQYGLTSATLTRLKSNANPAETEADLRFCWEVNYATISGKKFLIIIHAYTRYCMIYCDIKPCVWKDFIAFMHEEIRQAFLREGFNDQEAEKYFSMSSDGVVTKTHGKKVIGGLNHITTNLPYFLPSSTPTGKDSNGRIFLADSTNFFNNEICTFAIHPEWKYFHPDQAFKQEMVKLLR